MMCKISLLENKGSNSIDIWVSFIDNEKNLKRIGGRDNLLSSFIIMYFKACLDILLTVVVVARKRE